MNRGSDVLYRVYACSIDTVKHSGALYSAEECCQCAIFFRLFYVVFETHTVFGMLWLGDPSGHLSNLPTLPVSSPARMICSS
ncbi:hypothetical protein GYMLUDRAFT_70113 [Collybiopsis luxurians FD-317 M1]|nr:hypothetical protein GYMLUDRAFT_70113 [Collybiopsis luxurians FD-317 M1]